MAGTPAPLDPGTLIGGALDSIENGVGDVAQPALILGGAMVAIGVAWRFVRRFVKP